jgi:predicted lipoprotein with Yx(FWY)xxD motif
MTQPNASGQRRRRWVTRGATALVAAATITAVTADLAAAQASPAATKKVQVVKVVTRKPFGKILSKKSSGLSLYYMPSGTCTGECLSVWPPLLMRKGSTATPAGVKCLGTAKFAKYRQVTYRGHRLYTFTQDSGTSVNGNGEGGFVVAKVVKGSCPKASSGGGGGGW